MCVCVCGECACGGQGLLAVCRWVGVGVEFRGQLAEVVISFQHMCPVNSTYVGDKYFYLSNHLLFLSFTF